MIDLKVLQQTDPVQKQTGHGLDDSGLSPMDPPDAFHPPASDVVPYEDLHPFLQRLFDEHKEFSKALDDVERLLYKIQTDGFNKEVNERFAAFFRLLDQEMLPHHKTEELWLFPILQRRLLEHDEHSKANYPLTAVDMMMEDHVKIIQLSALAFNLMSLTFRLPDRTSSLVVLDLAIAQCKNLHETLKLHIFREDHIIWPLAHKYLTYEEFDALQGRRESSNPGEH